MTVAKGVWRINERSKACFFRCAGGAVNEGQSLLIKASGCWDYRGRDLYREVDAGGCQIMFSMIDYSW
jgi:hypothetical protein